MGEWIASEIEGEGRGVYRLAFCLKSLKQSANFYFERRPLTHLGFSPIHLNGWETFLTHLNLPTCIRKCMCKCMYLPAAAHISFWRSGRFGSGFRPPISAPSMAVPLLGSVMESIFHGEQ